MQPQFILFVIFIISSSVGAQQLANDPSRNGQGYAYSASNTGSDLYGNQQVPLDPRANPNMALPNDLNNIFQQALSSLTNINQELQNTMQNQQRTLTSGMGGLGVPFMAPNNGFNLGMPAIQGLPLLSGFPPAPGFPNFNGQPSAAPASMIPGLLQSAATILQQNPAIPNLLNRLSPEPQRNSFGVYSSSQSSSFNPNVVPKSYSEATSTINDNGNITTYTAFNP